MKKISEVDYPQPKKEKQENVKDHFRIQEVSIVFIVVKCFNIKHKYISSVLKNFEKCIMYVL